MPLLFLIIHLVLLGVLGLLAVLWLSNSWRALVKTWAKHAREGLLEPLLVRSREVVILMGIMLISTVCLSALQLVRHFPDLANIHNRTRKERVSGVRDYNLIRRIIDERPWYRESITGKGSILDRSQKDSLALARYHFDVRDSVFERYAPLGEASIHLVGYSTRIRGKSGLEAAYNRYLLGEEAYKDRMLNALFRTRKAGSNLELTIDYDLQKATYESLKKHLTSQRTTRGSACVMNPHTGEILAMVTQPSYTLDVVTSNLAWMVLNHKIVEIGEDTVAVINPGRNDTLFTLKKSDYPEDTPVGHAIKYSIDKPLLFRAVRGIYPPGSTFKTVMTAAAFEKDFGDFTYHSEGKGYVPKGGFRRPIRSHGKPKDWGKLDLYKALEISDNEYFCALADTMGGDIVGEFARKMGIAGPMKWNSRNDRLNEFASMHIRDIPYKPNDNYDVVLSGIGQGVLVTNPLRMAVAVSVIASGGYRPDPMLEKGLTPKRERVLSSETCDKVIKAMRGAVEGEDGTAKMMAVYVKDMPLAAKTGTAQPQTVGSVRDHSWFVCVAPADDPKLVIAVMGENAGWGSVVGLRTAKDVILAARRLGYFDEEPGFLERLFGGEEKKADVTGGDE
jgi:penicillin-binding protein A